jgi:hypothetical protein
VNPAVVKQLPPHVHDAYVHAFSSALQPVFIVAAGISAVAFILTWMLREIPLRKTTAAGAAAAEAEAAAVAKPVQVEAG